MDDIVKNVYQITAQQRMWRSMRIMKQFSLIDLQVTARGEEELLNEETARRYINFLVTHKYLEKNGNWYKLLKDTGVYAPLVKRNKNLYDDNLAQELEYPKQVKYLDMMFDYVSDGKEFTIKKLEETIGCSNYHAREYVKKLRQENKLSMRKKGGEAGVYKYIF